MPGQQGIWPSGFAGFQRVCGSIEVSITRPLWRSIAWMHRLDQLLAEQGRLEAEVEQLGVDRVVVVLFLLDPRVLDVLDLDRVAEVLAGGLDQLGQLERPRTAR